MQRTITTIVLSLIGLLLTPAHAADPATARKQEAAQEQKNGKTEVRKKITRREAPKSEGAGKNTDSAK